MSYQSSLLKDISTPNLHSPFDQSTTQIIYPTFENVYDRNLRLAHQNIDTWEMLGDDYEVVLDTNLSRSERRECYEVFKERFLESEVLSIDGIKEYCEDGGVPNEARAVVWQLFLDYLPISRAEQHLVLKEKRALYITYLKEYYLVMTGQDEMMKQIDNDVVRTHPEGFDEIFENRHLRISFCRILYIWCSVNPDISYYQGLNELCFPFFIVFLTSCFGDVSDVYFRSNSSFKAKSKLLLPSIEADVYWCIDAILTRLKKNHIFTNAGIYAESMVAQLDEVMQHVNPTLITHITNLGLNFFHFGFRWMLCLMTRELSTKNLVKLWDHYILEPEGFEELHVYFCAAFLNYLADACLACEEMEDLLMLLQNPKSHDWKWDVLKGILERSKIIRDHFKSVEQIV